jgi:hypothetical protein
VRFDLLGETQDEHDVLTGLYQCNPPEIVDPLSRWPQPEISRDTTIWPPQPILVHDKTPGVVLAGPYAMIGRAHRGGGLAIPDGYVVLLPAAVWAEDLLEAWLALTGDA